ncbi:hypothetical protein QBC36DRAFT_324158 [Triangularia setosa]|uniref:Secreted protein n=1 Tax=Triangularia setosa TaxID=2587417 RepID=A0AAN6WBQ8_9PEZI|nr:hypothetical protein QBC36DRAFT_324158 [Podospora setosa]
MHWPLFLQPGWQVSPLLSFLLACHSTLALNKTSRYCRVILGWALPCASSTSQCRKRSDGAGRRWLECGAAPPASRQTIDKPNSPLRLLLTLPQSSPDVARHHRFFSRYHRALTFPMAF